MMGRTMRLIAGLILVSSANVHASTPNPHVMTNRSTQLWANCLAYNAIRLDDQKSDVASLIRDAMTKCTREWGHLTYWYGREVGPLDAQTEDKLRQGGIGATTDRIEKILISVRSSQKIFESSDASN